MEVGARRPPKLVQSQKAGLVAVDRSEWRRAGVAERPELLPQRLVVGTCPVGISFRIDEVEELDRQRACRGRPHLVAGLEPGILPRSEVGRVGKECVRTCRSRW